MSRFRLGLLLRHFKIKVNISQTLSLDQITINQSYPTNNIYSEVQHTPSHYLLLMKKLLILLLTLFTLTTAAIHVRNGRIVDNFGGELIFHGLNLVSKVPPYHTTFNETHMEHLQELGINGIRLGVMWPGVQPRKQEFNQTYLQLMRQTVEDSANYRIYTLVQFHQDLFSQKFCADGVPVWAVPYKISKGFPRPLNLKPFQFDENGFPHYQDCSKHPWSAYYFSNSVAKAFDAIWTNKHGMRDMFIKYWRKVAETFKDSEHVIAYQLMNEPWPGDQYSNPLVMIPGLSEIVHMQHAYDIISAQIREVDPNHSICFEPVTWLNYFKAGFSHPPGGRKYSNSSILCYHYYNPPTLNLKKFMKARMKDIDRLKIGGLLSEFYVINEQGEKNIEMMNHCDANLQSWFGWIYPIQANTQTPRQMQSQDNLDLILYNEEWSVRQQLVKGITRTYAPRVAGYTVSQNYDPKSKKFVLVYEICTTCGETSIFVSTKYIYISGFNVVCFPSDGVRWQKDSQHYIRVLPRNIQANTRVTVTITAI